MGKRRDSEEKKRRRRKKKEEENPGLELWFATLVSVNMELLC